ncbi:MAG: glycosyltransferase family 4 protein [Chloroflexota bacterium]|nr:glycosyltransferase family 4 protein [Chloroflexota bacterium]
MHIMHIIDSLVPGGAERMLVDIANASAAAGERVSVCVTRNGLTLAAELRPDIALLVLNRQRRIEWGAMRRFAAQVAAAGVDVLHVHGRTSFSFAALIKTLRLIDRPIVLHDHYGIEMNAAVPRWFRLWGWRLVDQYVGVYPRLVTWAQSAGVPADRTRSIGNALDFARLSHPVNDLLRREQAIEPDTRVGIVVGGLRREKGIELLLTSLVEVDTTVPFVICIIGKDTDPAYAQACRARAAELRLDDRVRFIGERTDAALLAQGADFALMPSRSESGPLVLIEYMAAGLPFVAFQVGSISDTAADAGVPGFVPPLDTSAFAQAIESLLALSPDERRLRGQHGAQIAGAHFRIEAKLQAWFAVYRAAIGREKP